MSVRFIFHGPSLLTFKTDRLDLRGLDPGKSARKKRDPGDEIGESDVKGSLA